MLCDLDLVTADRTLFNYCHASLTKFDSGYLIGHPLSYEQNQTKMVFLVIRKSIAG